jgi:hypothetical protein
MLLLLLLLLLVEASAVKEASMGGVIPDMSVIGKREATYRWRALGEEGPAVYAVGCLGGD